MPIHISSAAPFAHHLLVDIIDNAGVHRAGPFFVRRYKSVDSRRNKCSFLRAKKSERPGVIGSQSLARCCLNMVYGDHHRCGRYSGGERRSQKISPRSLFPSIFLHPLLLGDSSVNCDRAPSANTISSALWWPLAMHWKQKIRRKANHEISRSLDCSGVGIREGCQDSVEIRLRCVSRQKTISCSTRLSCSLPRIAR